MTNAKVSPFQPVVTLGGKKLNDFGDRLDSERFKPFVDFSILFAGK